MNIIPIQENFGAKVFDVDLSKPMDSTAFHALYDAWLSHSILVFPGQQLTPDQQISFSRLFGELDIHVFKKALHPNHPEIYRLSNVMEAGKQIGKGSTQYWHSDLSYMDEPAKASLLYSIEAPEVGGDTLYADMYAAYDELPASLKEKIEKIEVVHNFTDFPARYARMNNTMENVPVIPPEIRESMADVVHPMVIQHPETGKRALYVNAGFSVSCVGLPSGESEALLKELFERAVQEKYIYRHKWKVGDVVLWDNRCVIHSATGGYQAPMRRLMHRTTIHGSRPTPAWANERP
ncbi:MAG: TauD/TfdA family dioxygenase [Achromobacter sp.]|uniref:TauD/TfdA dioxygenase family protein n=1 Tax=Achromobacter sp. TaxID=134375 RepID=UPI0012CC38B6|nr:TauD/TfdA family dioxygenase [Achromobacter sp.]MPS79707.1 TauD/TfdA family dioxygenase [Achromobacter sp.]